MFAYFQRGLTLYWNESEALVREAHSAALDAVRRGFPTPGPIIETDTHPSRLGSYAWRVSDPTQMG